VEAEIIKPRPHDGVPCHDEDAVVIAVVVVVVSVTWALSCPE